MKKTAIYILLSTSLLSGCADFAQKMVNAMDAMGAEDPTGITQMERRQAEIERTRIGTPYIRVNKSVPEGEFIQKYENGKVDFKTVIQNGCFDKYFDNYYPNGKLRSHTPLVDCKGNGLAHGYTEDGDLINEIYYVDSFAQGKIKAYGKDGKVSQFRYYDLGYPISQNAALERSFMLDDTGPILSESKKKLPAYDKADSLNYLGDEFTKQLVSTNLRSGNLNDQRGVSYTSASTDSMLFVLDQIVGSDKEALNQLKFLAKSKGNDKPEIKNDGFGQYIVGVDKKKGCNYVMLSTYDIETSMSRIKMVLIYPYASGSEKYAKISPQKMAKDLSTL